MGWVLGGAMTLSGQLPMEPVREKVQSVTGAFEGWYPNPDGTFTMLVGYFNRNSKEILDIPVGPNNRLEPGGPDKGQPTHFQPRRHWGVFTVTVPKDFGNKRLNWIITANGQTTSIPLNLNPLWVVEPFKDAGIGNTPPTIKFQATGPTFQGPPKGFAATYNAKTSEPLELTLWAVDDGKAPPERGARGGAVARATVSWHKFRGPGEVVFANVRPTAEGADGKATTTATFKVPGEYVLRAQANDGSGEGGGGFQCCWTNAHIKVTVTATTAGNQ